LQLGVKLKDPGGRYRRIGQGNSPLEMGVKTQKERHAKGCEEERKRERLGGRSPVKRDADKRGRRIHPRGKSKRGGGHQPRKNNIGDREGPPKNERGIPPGVCTKKDKLGKKQMKRENGQKKKGEGQVDVRRRPAGDGGGRAAGGGNTACGKKRRKKKKG